MKLISKLTFTSAVLALAFVSVASAESMRVSVPFGFRACGQTLPAGDYRVELNLTNQRITSPSWTAKPVATCPSRPTPDRALRTVARWSSIGMGTGTFSRA